MNPIKLAFLLPLLLIAACSDPRHPLTLGDTVITIPIPKGFVATTDISANLSTFYAALPRSYTVHGLILRQQENEAFLKGQPVDLEFFSDIISSVYDDNTMVTREQWESYKTILRNKDTNLEIDEYKLKINKAGNEHLKQLNKENSYTINSLEISDIINEKTTTLRILQQSTKQYARIVSIETQQLTL